MIVIALTIAASACADAADPEATAWHADLPSEIETTPLRTAITAELYASLGADSLVPATCVEETAAKVTDILVTSVGVPGLRTLGVSADDASAVTSDAFLELLPPDVKGLVVGAVAECIALAQQLSAAIPGVSYQSLSCLIERLSNDGFFEMTDAALAVNTFSAAKTSCLDADERAAYDVWSAAQLAAPPPVVLSPVDCSSLETTGVSAALGFSIDQFEPSMISMNADRPVGCTFGNPDESEPWVLLYVATQDFQRELYADFDPPVPEFAETWSTLTEVLDYAGVYFIAQGAEVEWYDGAVTARFQDGNTTAAVTAGDYVLMVSANSGDQAFPLSRAELAGAVKALAASLALG